jgi:hypothetical protein
MKHIVCFSGGVSSALVAVEVTRKFGVENTILLNHDISALRENADVKRFKREVAAYLNIQITYANYQNLAVEDLPDQFDVLKGKKTITNFNGQALCTHFLKTKPFMDFILKNKYNVENGEKAIFYYGFDANEAARIQRRIGVMSAQGHATDYPLAFWKERTIFDIQTIGIVPPLTYGVWKHANCTGCLKGGILHWYTTFVHDREAFNKASDLEIDADYSINRITTKGEKSQLFLYELAPYFDTMQSDGIPATEHQSAKSFVILLKNKYGLISESKDVKPCECAF